MIYIALPASLLALHYHQLMTHKLEFSLRLPDSAVIVGNTSRSVIGRSVNSLNFVDIYPISAVIDAGGEENVGATEHEPSADAAHQQQQKRRRISPQKRRLPPSESSSESESASESELSEPPAPRVSLNPTKIVRGQLAGLEILQRDNARAYLPMWEQFEGRKELDRSAVNRTLFGIRRGCLIIGATQVSSKVYLSFKHRCFFLDITRKISKDRAQGFEIQGFRFFPLETFTEIKVWSQNGTCILIATMNMQSPFVDFANARSVAAPRGFAPITAEYNYLAAKMTYENENTIGKLIDAIHEAAKELNLRITSTELVDYRCCTN